MKISPSSIFPLFILLALNHSVLEGRSPGFALHETGGMAPDTVIPKIFIKGQSERLEDLLNQQFPKQIVYVFNDNVNAAFSACAHMVLDIEKYGDQTGFDIRGIKAFVTFYFDRKGNIRHIAYSLKGNSRYFKPEELERFFRQFMNVYRMQVNSKYNFQHEFQLIIPLPWIVEKH